MEPQWGYDENLFRREAEIGQTYSEEVAKYLNYHKIKCHATDLEFAKDVADRERFKTGEQDIIFDNMPGCLEVKSRRLAFSATSDSYPYDTAFVDTVSGWEAKDQTPLAVVLISQLTRNMLVIPPSTKKYWTEKRSFDRIRRINETWYQCPKNHLKSMDLLVEFLQYRQAHHS
jgi:hypothetical protein